MKCQRSADVNNYNLQNVECRSLVPSCEISSRSPRFAKEAFANINDILRRSLCSVASNQRAPAAELTAPSQCFQIARVANIQASSHSIVASQWHGNPTLTVHAVRSCA